VSLGFNSSLKRFACETAKHDPRRKRRSRPAGGLLKTGAAAPAGDGTIPPVRRRLMNLVTVVSLLLCVAVCVLWVRSYIADDVLIHSDGRTALYNVRSTTGELWLIVCHLNAEMNYVAPTRLRWDSDRGHSRLATSNLVESTFLTRSGFACSTNGRFSVLAAPHWMVAVTSAVLPTLGVLRLRRQRTMRNRRSRALCLRCGYDLRATPDRCPECGTTRASG
jgi:hypothetical protein